MIIPLCFISLTALTNAAIVLSGTDKVSKMGIGTWAWGDSLFWKYKQEEDAALKETFDYCCNAGVNLFDTAEVYGFGRSELLCGRFRRQLLEQSNGTVSNLPVLATKFAPLPWRIGADAVVYACQESLDRMGVDSMGLYQIHWPGVWQNKEYWEGICKCYQKGLIENVGVSNYGPKMLEESHKFMADRGVPLASNQIQYSLLSRSAESNGLLRKAHELDVSILAYSPLAQGILTGKFDMNNLPEGPRASTTKRILPKVKSLLEAMSTIAKGKSESTGTEVTCSQVALNYCISKGTIPIPGARKITQAVDNCNALGWELSIDEVTLLDIRARASGVEMPTPLQRE